MIDDNNATNVLNDGDTDNLGQYIIKEKMKYLNEEMNL